MTSSFTGGRRPASSAAVEAGRDGRSVVLVCPDKHLGGLSAGGLGWTDTGRKEVIGGLAREFYHRVWKHYQSDEAWRWQTREEYGNKGQGNGRDRRREANYVDLRAPRGRGRLRRHGCRGQDSRRPATPGSTVRTVWRRPATGLPRSRRSTGRLTVGVCSSTATYEGDLLAAAGRSAITWDENRPDTYGEEWNGVQKAARHHGHNFPEGVSPYVKPGDPSSGLLPRISSDPPGEEGQGDRRVQAYCFRMCLTDVAENRLPFPKPEGYDPSQYELILRVFDTGWRQDFQQVRPDSQPQDRHQQPWPVQHRQHRLQLRLPRRHL